MPRGINLSEQLKQKIVDLHKSGVKQVDIASRFVLHKSVVSKTISNYKNRETVKSIKKSGRPRKTSKKLEQRIKWISQQNPKKSSAAILKELGDVNISYKTVQRRLIEVGLFSRRSAKKPMISSRNRKARLNFAKKYLHWTAAEWKKVLFSDESKFNLFGSDGMQWVHRPVGKRYDPKYTRPTIKHGGGSVMVWGCVSGYGTGPLFVIEGILDRFGYLDILKNEMLTYAEEHLPITWIFQQDNDPKHKSRVIRDWLENESIRVLDFPAQSPDLNIIENLWERLDGQVRKNQISNKQDLIRILNTAWKNISPDVIHTLIESIPRRLQEVIKNKGYSTHY